MTAKVKTINKQACQPTCKQRVRVVQLTDPHLGPSADYQLAGINTCDSLNAVLERCRDMADAFVVTGDVAGDGALPAYELFDKKLSAESVPYYWLPGNHDDLETMAATLATPFRFEVTLGNWLLLMLDSRQPGKVGGHIGERQLQAALAAAEKHNGPVAVFMHHPLVDVNCAWLDKQKVSGGDAILEQLAERTNIKAVFSGHVHQPTTSKRYGIPVYTTPSTCFQFAANSDEFAFGDQGPGFRWIDFNDNGSIDTGVIELPAIDSLDRRCVGY
ncbi:metallophosphoesterase [Porticoccus sp. GXU_MW_L64]